MNYELFATLSHDDTRLAPGEIIHVPERVEWDIEREDWNGEDIEYHPADHVPFAPENEHKCLEAVDCCQHDDSKQWDLLVFTDDKINEVDDLCNTLVANLDDFKGHTYVSNGDGLDNGRQKIDEDDESHREAAKTAKTIKEYQFCEIVDSRVDPSTPLRQQDLPLIRSNGVGMSIPNELGLIVREVLQKKSCQVTIFAQM